MNWKALRDPFPVDMLKWRLGMTRISDEGTVQWAQALVYLSNQDIMDRLDNVVGPENWKNEFLQWGSNGQLCGISIRMEDGTWVTKWDGADRTDIEPVKGGLTGAMKRAAVQWGIGRYLYEVEGMYAQITDKGKHKGEAKSRSGTKVYFRWDAPRLPPDFPRPSVGESPSAPQQTSPQVKPVARPAQPEDWREVTVHFGNLQGKKLSELNPKQLEWFQTTWVSERKKRSVSQDDEPLFNALLVSMNQTEETIHDPKEEIPF